ncbi:MAG: hypothetical protein V4510_10620 [bacterium]
MTSGTPAVKIFMGFQHDSKYHDSADRIAFGSAIQARAAPMAKVSIEYGDFPAGDLLLNGIEAAISSSDLCILDISENNQNVLIECGIAIALRKRIVLIKHNSSGKNEIPSNLGGVVSVWYTNLRGSHHGEPIAALVRTIHDFLEKSHPRDFYLRRLWALETCPKVYLVCSRLPEAGSSVRFEDYIRLRKFGDLDALVTIRETIARLFPTTEIESVQADSTSALPQDWQDSHLVLIGGPDRNPLAKWFEGQTPFAYSYPNDHDVAIFDRERGAPLMAEVIHKPGREQVEDTLLFTKRRLSGSPHAKLIVIGGAYTWGVLAAAQLFSAGGPRVAAHSAERARLVVQHLGDDPSFSLSLRVIGSRENLSVSPLTANQLIPIQDGAIWR